MSGSTLSDPDQELEICLMKYGSIKHNLGIDDPNSEHHSSAIVEFSYDSAMQNLKSSLPMSIRSTLDDKLLSPFPRGSHGLMDGLVTRGCGFESRLRQELSTTEVRPLSKAPNPQMLPGRHKCRLPTAPSVGALGWVNCREHISLLVILCVIVYVIKNIYIFYYIPFYVRSLGSVYTPATSSNVTEGYLENLQAIARDSGKNLAGSASE